MRRSSFFGERLAERDDAKDRPPTEEELEESGRSQDDTNLSGTAPPLSGIGIGTLAAIIVMYPIGFFVITMGIMTLGLSDPIVGFEASIVGVLLIVVAAYGTSKKAQDIRMRGEEAEAPIEGNGIGPERFEFARIVREVWLEPRNDREVEIRRPVWGTCRRCGAAIIVPDSSFCSNCGASLSIGSKSIAGRAARREPRSILREATRSTRIESCMVCRMRVERDDSFVRCPYCGKAAHKTHLLEWLHVKDYCPACRTPLAERELAAQIEQKFRAKRGARRPISLRKKGKARS